MIIRYIKKPKARYRQIADAGLGGIPMASAYALDPKFLDDITGTTTPQRRQLPT